MAEIKTVQKNLYAQMRDAFGSLVSHMDAKYPERAWAYRPEFTHWAELASAEEDGKQIVWFNSGMSSEIFLAMDLLPHQIESMLAGGGAFPEVNLTELIDISHEYAPEYLCSGLEAAAGALFSGRIPKPVAIVATTHPCDSMRAVTSLMSHYYDIPIYVVDAPYWNTDNSYKFMAEQIKGMVDWLTDLTGNKLDKDKLVHVMNNSNEALKYQRLISNLRKQKPCPTKGTELLLDAAINAYISGTDESVEYFKKRYEVAKAVADKGVGAIPDEKHRLFCLYVPPMFAPGIFTWVEKEFGAIFVTDMMEYRPYDYIDTSDPERIYFDFAKKCSLLPMGHHFRGAGDDWMNYALDVTKEYQIDGVVFFGAIACRNAWALAKLVKDKIEDKLGVPVLNLEVDPLDGRVVTEDVLKTKIKDFIDIRM